MAVDPRMTRGNTLGRYDILHELGRGAIGAVYAARDRSTGAVLALKILGPALLNKSHANFAELFLKDARSAARLSHRNIVKIHDAGEAGGTAYVAMELLEGESLRKILDDGPLSIARAIRIARDIACGLAYAHEQGVVHGGLKPSNIIVLHSGGVKISDFRVGQLGEAAILSGQRAGCLSYMSPEQVRGDPVQDRSDIFSFGAVFYEMLTRRPPFKGDSPNEIMKEILHAEPPLPSDVNPHVPRILDGIALSMLAGHPDDRLSGARILLRDLQRLEEELGLGPGATVDTDAPTAGLPPAGREPMQRTSVADRLRDGDVIGEASRFPPRGQTQPAAPQPPPDPEPRLRGPDPNRSPGHAPMHDASRFPRSPGAGELPYRKRIPDAEAFDEREAMLMMDRESERQRSSGSRPGIFATLALVLAVLAIVLTVFLHYSPGLAERLIDASRVQLAPATAPAPSRPAAPAPVAEAPNESATAPAAPQASPPRAADDARAKQEPLDAVSAPTPTPPEPLAAEPSPSAQTERDDAGPEQESLRTLSAPKPMPPEPPATEPSPAQPEKLVARASEQPAAAHTAPRQKLPRATQPTANLPEQQPGGTATLIIVVLPQGEIYVDGKHHGTTPPITTLDLEPGMHRIEIRSGSRKPYVTYMTVQAGDVRRIRHDFGAKPSRPPT
jgi:serine/threonine-protein kinase